MNFSPLSDLVVLRRTPTPERTGGGIYIPLDGQEPPIEGTVVATGPGGKDRQQRLIPMTVAPGDRVLFERWNAVEFRCAGDDLLIMHENQLLGVL